MILPTQVFLYQYIRKQSISNPLDNYIDRGTTNLYHQMKLAYSMRHFFFRATIV